MYENKYGFLIRATVRLLSALDVSRRCALQIYILLTYFFARRKRVPSYQSIVYFLQQPKAGLIFSDTIK